MRSLLLENPWFRILIPLLLMGVVSFSINTLVVEINQDQGIVWASIPSKISFYIFLLATIFLCVHQVMLFKRDKNLISGITPKQYEATIRNKVAEDVAKRSRKLIKDGKVEQLEKETEVFNKLYGDSKR